MSLYEELKTRAQVTESHNLDFVLCVLCTIIEENYVKKPVKKTETPDVDYIQKHNRMDFDCKFILDAIKGMGYKGACCTNGNAVNIHTNSNHCEDLKDCIIKNCPEGISLILDGEVLN